MNANALTCFQYRLALPNNGNATVLVEQKVNGVYQYLTAPQTQTTSGLYEIFLPMTSCYAYRQSSLPIVSSPNQENIRISVNGTSGFTLNNLSLDRDNVDTLFNRYLVSPSDYGEPHLSSVFTSYACSGYRYGFQAQEKDDEVKGVGNSVNYTYRMHDPRLGRFFAVDPLGRKFPWNSPYAFIENRVVDGVELEGLEAFFIHVTNSSPNRWNDKSVKTLKSLTNNKTVIKTFSWEDLDGTTNNSNDRYKAAKRLVEHIKANRVEGEEITLIGHSHGGNVAIQAAKMFYDETGEQVNLVTIATPAYEKNSGTSKWENPGTTKGEAAINDHIHIFSLIDGVQGGLAGKEAYSNSPKVRQYVIDVSSEYNYYEWMDAHSFDVEHPELIQKEVDSNNIKKLNKIKQ